MQACDAVEKIAGGNNHCNTKKEIILKDGAKCLLRGAGEADAAEVLRTFDLTHAETDYFLTYPEENSFTVQEEAKFFEGAQRKQKCHRNCGVR